MGKLDWKWIGIGVLIMAALGLAAAFVFGLVMGPQPGVTDPSQIELTGGQMAVGALLNVLAFLIGGFIVGLKSAGRTIIEPGISAAIAVLILLVAMGSFSIVQLFTAGLVPFIAGVAGGWLGERRQGTTV